MEGQKTKITKQNYVLMVWALLIGGLIINGVTMYLFQTKVITNIYYLGLGLLLTGIGIGFAWAKSFKVEGIDK